MIIIPNRQTKKVTQNNRSKILGDLWSSFNLDLQSDLGMIKVSPRLKVNTSGVANQGLATAFSTYNNQIFALCDTRIFNNPAIDLTQSFTENVGTGAITTYSKDTGDLKTFNNTLCATADTKLMSYTGAGTTWTQRATIGTGALHKMVWFVKFNRLYYLDFDTGRNVIKSLDTSWAEATSGDYFIDLTNGYELSVPYTLDSDGSDMWIGMMNLSSAFNGNQFSGGHILRWDGISNQITTDYKIKGRGILALCKDDRNIMHALDTNGALLQFTGSGFEEIGRLPLNRSLLTNSNSSKYDSFVHPNGLQFTRNGTFIVSVNNLMGDSTGTIKDNLASGIWEFHKDTGFVHRQPFSYSPINTTTVTDYGQNRISRIGALMEADIGNTSANGKPTIICGATYYTDASTTANGIFVDDPLNTTQKYGNFVTSWFLSGNLKDNWNKIALKYRRFLDSTDKICLKYRTIDAPSTEFTITWTSVSTNTTIFSSSLDLTNYVGQEIEVLQGTGSGKCAHIVSCQGSGSIVVVDEQFTGATGTAKARVQAWNKALVVNDQLTESFLKTISATSERIQIKCCMQFTGDDELHELIVVNNSNTPLA